ncbi:hypothetical protein B566_EDAN009613 [Ephemera danica]|nr:hypothetical protein B566_EDAN009613 [Ephemera danica]
MNINLKPSVYKKYNYEISSQKCSYQVNFDFAKTNLSELGVVVCIDCQLREDHGPIYAQRGRVQFCETSHYESHCECHMFSTHTLNVRDNKGEASLIQILQDHSCVLGV